MYPAPFFWKNTVEARPSIELPRLRDLADDIVTLIDAEYR
jgi:hypothetical protein